MNPGWYVFALCALALIGATLPLLHERRMARKTRRTDNPKFDDKKAHDGKSPDRPGSEDQPQ